MATYYVSTTGNDSTGDGSIGNPWFDPEYGALQLIAGDILYIRGGTYYGVNTNHYGPTYDDIEILYIDGAFGTAHSGTAGNLITMQNYPGETVTFDGTNLTGVWYRQYGIYLNGCDYWHIKGINITNMIHRGYLDTPPKYCPSGMFLYSCQNCIIELCSVYTTEGRGFDAQQPVDNEEDRHSTGNLFLNCDAYDNYDLHTYNLVGENYVNQPGTNGDGFGLAFTHSGCTNTWKGCRSWYNSDDGYDTILNDGVVIIDSCWAWDNGRGTHGNGQGFKLGDLRLLPVEDKFYRIMYNCLAWDNRENGVASNGVEGKVKCYNNTVYHNITKGFNFDSASLVVSEFYNNISDENTYGTPTGVNDAHFRTNFIWGYNSFDLSPNYEWNAGDDFLRRTDIVTVDQFITLDDTGMDGARGSNGELPITDFLRLKEGSVYIGAGVNTGLILDGEGKPWLNPPSLGAFEYGSETVVMIPKAIIHNWHTP